MDYELVPVEGYDADCEGGGEGEEERQEEGGGQCSANSSLFANNLRIVCE